MNKAKSESSNSTQQVLSKKKLIKIKSSFFDDITAKTSSFWTRIMSQNTQESMIEKDIEGMLYKETKRATMKEKNVSICGDRFIIYEADGKTGKKFIDLNNSLLERILNEDGPEKRHGFRITKNQKCSDFYTQGLQVSDIWYKFLKRSCIQRSFQHSYNIDKLIGKGNFAKVYSATNKNTSKLFAVKAFDKDKFQDINVDKPALIKELSIMRKMDHKGVLKLYEVFENETYIFLVCEFLEGGEFFHHLKKTISYDEHLLAAAIYNIIQAVEYIHSKGVLHRDIKPENIILRTKGDIKDIVIADFGLADYYNPKGQYQFQRCGTPGYVAPELLQDKFYDYKIDIFSIGVLMFIMLSGNSPFQSLSYNDIVLKNYNCDIDFKSNGLDKKMSPEASELLHDLLDVNPNKRPTATNALKYRWFSIHLNNQQNTNSQLFALNGPLIHFNPQENPELYSKTPLMNQELYLSINSTPLGVTPQIRSKSNTYGDGSPDGFQFQAQVGPKQSPQKSLQKQLVDDFIDENDVGDEVTEQGHLEKYQMLTKIKRYAIPERNESSENFQEPQKQPNQNTNHSRSVLKDFGK